MKDIDIHSVRSQFPMMQSSMSGAPFVYLDSSATTHKPRCVIEAISTFYSKHYATVHRAVYELAADATERYDAVRHKVRHFINARHVEEIIFTRGTTEAINLVASSFGRSFIQPGDEILVCETEHHSNIVPWQMMCEQRGATLKVLPCIESSEIDMDAAERLITKNVKMIAIAHMANTTGTIHPIKEIIRLARQVGAYVLIDGAQAICHMDVNVEDLDADFYVFSGHKMYGPTGIGILYGKLDLLSSMAPYHGGGDMVETVTFEKTTYQSPPLRFEAGTPLIAEVMGLGAAISFIQSIGKSNIESYEQKLFSYALDKMVNIPGLKVIGSAKERGPIISFTIDGVHPLDLGTMLGLKGIALRTGHMCAQPTLRKYGLSSMARVSFGVYNTFEDVDVFIRCLQEVLLLLLPGISE